MNQVYASKYGVYALFVDRVGAEKDLTYLGGSQVIDPFDKTIAEAQGDTFDYIEVFYNRTRRHSHLGGVSPEAFERASV